MRQLMNDAEVKLILGNSNKRFSGVTSTMLQVLPVQSKLTGTAVLGSHHLPENFRTLSFVELTRLCRKPLPDGSYRVFHARRNDEMIQALIAKMLFGAKIKIAFTSTAQREHSGFSRWLMQKMDAVITTSNAAAAYLHHRPPDIIVPHGIDASRFQPTSSRDALWQKTGFPGEFGVGIFGRVRYSKGIDIFVDAALPLLNKYPGATLVISGHCMPKDRNYLDKINQKINAAGHSQRVVFTGEQPFDALPPLFAAMSIVAALSREEGFGLTPLEAMASATAVLTSEAGAWPDVVRDGIDGFRVPIGDVAATRQKLDSMLSNPEATEAMGIAGRERVLEHYTVEREARRLTDFLLSLANPNGRPNQK
ncbi:MAG: glycosyltransferase family 4 protein [Gammaproteobacteria bacterium]|nr:glycosyltransferase family 4 protein [Gammaproteobacteria bacterium]NNM12324.1 glycosyltransferase family 4 protein [Pseudomonadales bacterium]RZV55310.1 MAG: glycosyltransferase family 1 protein [Pseudomonadales bacterium]